MKFQKWFVALTLTIALSVHADSIHTNDCRVLPCKSSNSIIQKSKDNAILNFIAKGDAAYQKSDFVNAVTWFRKAAEKGDARGQVRLGRAYLNGQGVAQDNVEGIKLLREAAEQGDAQGQSTLGIMYLSGRGVAKNDGEAVKLLREAAEQGDVQGQFALGGAYVFGLGGVPQDYVEAAKWFRKSAEQGNSFAQVYLGGVYENGQGVAKDDAEAVKWYRKAAGNGNDDAKRRLAELEKSGSVEIIQEKIDSVKAKREAEKQAKQDRLDAIKTEREKKRQEKIRLAEGKRIAKEGDGSAYDLTCKSYGARPGTQVYINCRIQLAQKEKAEQAALTAQQLEKERAEQAALAAQQQENNRQIAQQQRLQAAQHRQQQLENDRSTCKEVAQQARAQREQGDNTFLAMMMGMSALSGSRTGDPQTGALNSTNAVMKADLAGQQRREMNLDKIANSAYTSCMGAKGW